jgi:hypothetical protein
MDLLTTVSHRRNGHAEFPSASSSARPEDLNRKEKMLDSHEWAGPAHCRRATNTVRDEVRNPRREDDMAAEDDTSHEIGAEV